MNPAALRTLNRTEVEVSIWRCTRKYHFACKLHLARITCIPALYVEPCFQRSPFAITCALCDVRLVRGLNVFECFKEFQGYPD